MVRVPVHKQTDTYHPIQAVWFEIANLAINFYYFKSQVFFLWLHHITIKVLNLIQIELPKFQTQMTRPTIIKYIESNYSIIVNTTKISTFPFYFHVEPKLHLPSSFNLKTIKKSICQFQSALPIRWIWTQDMWSSGASSSNWLIELLIKL